MADVPADPCVGVAGICLIEGGEASDVPAIDLHTPSITGASCKGSKWKVDHDPDEPWFYVVGTGLSIPVVIPNPDGWKDAPATLHWEYECVVQSLVVGATGYGGLSRRVSMQWNGVNLDEWHEVTYSCEQVEPGTGYMSEDACEAVCDYDGVLLYGCSVNVAVYPETAVVVAAAEGTGDYPTEQSICIPTSLEGVNQFFHNYRELEDRVPGLGDSVDQVMGTAYDGTEAEACLTQDVTLTDLDADVSTLLGLVGLESPLTPHEEDAATDLSGDVQDATGRVVARYTYHRSDGTSFTEIPADGGCCGPADGLPVVWDLLPEGPLPLVPSGGTGDCAIPDESCSDIQCLHALAYPTPEPVACVGGMSIAMTQSFGPIVVSASILAWSVGPFEISFEAAVAAATGGSASVLGGTATTLDSSAVITDMRDGSVADIDKPTTRTCTPYLFQAHQTCGGHAASAGEISVNDDVNKYCAKANSEGTIALAAGSASVSVPSRSNSCSNAAQVLVGYMAESVGIEGVELPEPQPESRAPAPAPSTRADEALPLLDTLMWRGHLEAGRRYTAPLSLIGGEAEQAARDQLRRSLQSEFEESTARWDRASNLVRAIEVQMEDGLDRYVAGFDPIVTVRLA